MTKLERLQQQLAKLEDKRRQLLRSGRLLQANAMNEDMKRCEIEIRKAKKWEELSRPRPIKDILTPKQINESGIIPLMIECHLIADMLVETAYMVIDQCKEYGLEGVSFMPDLQDILKRCDKFSSFLTTVSPQLCDLLVRNETFNISLHKKYMKYIEQRLTVPKKSI